MTVTETIPKEESAAEDPSWLRASRGHTLWLLAACPLVPFAVLLVRVLAVRSPAFLFGDPAVSSVAARRALSWQQTLGIYDRFGWHHPGPSYYYLVATVERVLGTSHAAQAQLATVVALNGLCVVGSVLVVGRRWGMRAAAATAVVLTAVAALMGTGPPAEGTSSVVLNSIWTTDLIIFPLVFAGVLAAIAVHGSLPALVGSAVAASFAVQADVAPAGLGVLFILAGAVGCSVAWWKRGRPSKRELSTAAVLGAVLILMWVPPIIEQVTGSPGNLTLLWRFFVVHPQPKAGLHSGAIQVGYAVAFPFGVGSKVLELTQEPGLRQLFIAIAGGIVVLLVALRARRKSAATFAILGLVGIGAAVYSASSIVGLPAEYLTAWTAVPVILLLLSAAMLVAEGLAWLGPRVGRRAEAALAAGLVLVAFAGLMARATTVASSYSDPQVAQVWHLVAPIVAAHHHERVEVVATDFTSLGIASGVDDQIDSRGIPFSGQRGFQLQFLPGHTAKPKYWLYLANYTPPGFHVLGKVQTYTVSAGSVQPPEW